MAALGGGYNDINEVKTRLMVQPDHVFLYSNQIPRSLMIDNVMELVYIDPVTHVENVVQIFTIADLIRQLRIETICFIKKDTHRIVYYGEGANDPDIPISTIAVENMNRDEAEASLSRRTAPVRGTAYVIRRSGSRGEAISIRKQSSENDARLSHIISRTNASANVVPYNDDGSKNTAFFTRLFSIETADLMHVPGGSAVTLYRLYSRNIGPTNVHVVFNTDRDVDKMAIFSTITDDSLLYVIGQCEFEDEIDPDISEITTPNGTVILNPPITPENIRSIVGHNKNVVIVLYRCFGNNIAYPVSDLLQGNIIVSSRERVTRLGGFDIPETIRRLDDFFTNENSFITFWSLPHSISLNIPINLFNIRIISVGLVSVGMML